VLARALDVADPPEVDGTVDEHAANATIAVAVTATTTGRIRASQNRGDADRVICGSYASRPETNLAAVGGGCGDAGALDRRDFLIAELSRRLHPGIERNRQVTNSTGGMSPQYS